MGKAILLTGKPGCGKTTIIRKVVEKLQAPAGGFYTQEMRQGGRRVGFEIVTLDGRRGLLAHVSIKSQKRVGKYGLDLDSLESVGISAVCAALQAHKLVIIDEIGPMELASPEFRQVVIETLASACPLLGSIHYRSTPFIESIKTHPGVRLLRVTVENRQDLPAQVLSVLKNVMEQ